MVNILLKEPCFSLISIFFVFNVLYKEYVKFTTMYKKPIDSSILKATSLSFERETSQYDWPKKISRDS